MMEAIYGLYQNEHFTLYLVIALLTLVVLFFIVLLIGKKDQKLEETKRLQKIELEANKSMPKEKEQIETEIPVDEKLIEKPKEKIAVNVSEEEKEDVKVTTFEPEIDENNFPSFDEDAIEKDLQELEEIKKEFAKIDKYQEEPKPLLNEEKSSFKNSSVFSSVFVNKQSDEESNNKEISVSKPEVLNTSFMLEDEEEITMELPSLKK